MRMLVVLLYLSCFLAQPAAVAEHQSTGLAFEFAESQPIAHASLRANGAIYVYVRNAGNVPSSLKRVELFGINLDPADLPPWVAYVRQRPVELLPGEVGQVEIRLLNLPQHSEARRAQDASGRMTTSVAIVPNQGEPARGDVD